MIRRDPEAVVIASVSSRDVRFPVSVPWLVGWMEAVADVEQDFSRQDWIRWNESGARLFFSILHLDDKFGIQWPRHGMMLSL